MSDMSIEMEAFHDELVKTGAPFAQVAKQVFSKLRPGMAEAAGVGLRGARGIGEALRSGSGSVGSAIKATPGAVSRFGKRQLHGLTGWTPKAGPVSGRHGVGALESIGFQGSKASKAALDTAKAAPATKGGTGVLQKIMHGDRAGTQALADKVKSRAVGRAEKFHAASKAHEKAGLTSLPGWAKGMATKPAETLKAGIGKEWHSGSLGKAMVGLPVAASGYQLAKPTEAGGPGRLQRAGKSLGEMGWAMGMPIAGAMAAAKGISTLGGGVGRPAGSRSSAYAAASWACEDREWSVRRQAEEQARPREDPSAAVY